MNADQHAIANPSLPIAYWHSYARHPTAILHGRSTPRPDPSPLTMAQSSILPSLPVSRPPSPLSHRHGIVHRPRSIPTFHPSILPTFNLQPSIFNRLHLILEKKKIQITIEEQMLRPPFLCFPPSPVVPPSSTVHRQPSIINLRAAAQPSTLPSSVCSSKGKFKKTNPNQISTPCIYAIISSYPHIYGSRA